MEAIPKFADMAKAAGLPAKLGYKAWEVAKATGYSQRTVSGACQSGALGYYLPRGMKRGRLMTPAMVDAWLEGGSK